MLDNSWLHAERTIGLNKGWLSSAVFMLSGPLALMKVGLAQLKLTSGFRFLLSCLQYYTYNIETYVCIKKKYENSQ